MFNMLKCSVAQQCPTLCNPMDCSPPNSSVHGISQARILEWVAISFPKESSDPGIEPASPQPPALGGMFFVISASWEAPCYLYIRKIKYFFAVKKYLIL